VDYPPIENHGVIGDLRTAALVATNGAIDFMCFPDFDSPSVFASLLDARRGGRFRIAPVLGEAVHKQLYLPDTNVLLTRFLSDEGVAEVSDFMPVERDPSALPRVVRRAKTVRGRVRFRMECVPRFDYARAGLTMENGGHQVRFLSTGADRTALRLRTAAPLRDCDEGGVAAEFTLGANESMAFVLEDAGEGDQSPSLAEDYVSESFKRTVNFWRGWLGVSHYRGRWRETLNRSALTMKLLTSRRHGSMVAAPTFGLPEQIEGERNWDYRYTWIRDGSFAMQTFLRLGYVEEARAFMEWVRARCAEAGADGSLQVLYGLDGRSVPAEDTLDLEGYRGSRPVRVGNAAFGQLQLDIYGELLDAVNLFDRIGEPISHDFWTDLTRIVEYVCGHWMLADEGIWEVRSKRAELLYSRVQCWVALDRAIRIARRRSFPAHLSHWRGVRDRIFRDIHEHFWDAKRGAFVQHKGAGTLDASALLLPLIGFIAPRDPRWLSTLDAIGRELVDDSLVHRYKIDGQFTDGLRGQEGTFSMCTFWYVACLALGGDLQQARLVYEKMLGYANHLGLYAEEVGARGEQLGNFPQAFTHLGLVRAGTTLDRLLSRAGLRG